MSNSLLTSLYRKRSLYIINRTEHIQECLNKDFSIITLANNSKNPCIRLKQYQSQRASIDDLLSWCCVFNEHNLAIETGKVSGLVVVDLDNSSLLEELIKQLPGVKGTVKVKTKRGYYFHFSNNGNEIRTTNNYLNLGIEIKYNGCSSGLYFNYK